MLTRVPDWYRVRGIAGYDVVRIVLGLVLLTAAALKGHQLATEPVAETGLFTSRWFLIGVVEFELALGLWLLVGVSQLWSWRSALGCFTLFGVVALTRALAGEESCGCFGKVSVDPWFTFVLDFAAVTALLAAKPDRGVGEALRVGGKRRGSLVGVLAAWMVAAVSSAWAIGTFEPAAIAASGEILGQGRAVVLEPKRWVNQRFPLLPYVDVADELVRGKWIVVLYHHECPKCQDVVPRYEQLSRQLRDQCVGVCLIEIPPYEPIGGRQASVLKGRLSDGRDWFVSTPVELFLQEAIVTEARGN